MGVWVQGAPGVQQQPNYRRPASDGTGASRFVINLCIVPMIASLRGWCGNGTDGRRSRTTVAIPPNWMHPSGFDGWVQSRAPVVVLIYRTTVHLRVRRPILSIC